MKRFLLCLGLFFTSTALHCVGEENIPGFRGSYPQNSFGASNLTIFPKKTSHGTFSYSDSNLLFNPTIHTSSKGTYSALVGLRNLYVTVKNHIHPSNTTYGVLGLNSLYDGIENYRWTFGVTMQSGIRQASLTNNTRYIGTILGRYQKKKPYGISVGAYAEIFSRTHIVWPILGIDYTYRDFILEAIFPIKLGIKYQGFKNHIFSLVGRPIYTGFMVKKGFGKKDALACMKGAGLEVRYDYLFGEKSSFWIALGETLHTSLSIGNKNFHKKRHIHIPHSPYLNVGIMLPI